VKTKDVEPVLYYSLALQRLPLEIVALHSANAGFWTLKLYGYTPEKHFSRSRGLAPRGPQSCEASTPLRSDGTPKSWPHSRTSSHKIFWLRDVHHFSG
jgi:hypothetical protein